MEHMAHPTTWHIRGRRLLAGPRTLVMGILNITPDHLDRHGDLAGYVAAKARILEKLERYKEALDEYRIILKYDPDPRTFIKNALSPADVQHVVLLDDAKKQALSDFER